MDELRVNRRTAHGKEQSPYRKLRADFWCIQNHLSETRPRDAEKLGFGDRAPIPHNLSDLLTRAENPSLTLAPVGLGLVRAH